MSGTDRHTLLASYIEYQEGSREDNDEYIFYFATKLFAKIIGRQF